jgi:hypothetical protein
MIRSSVIETLSATLPTRKASSATINLANPKATNPSFDVGQTSVAKSMARHRRPLSQGWKTFLRNHADGIASIGLFVVPTISSAWLGDFTAPPTPNLMAGSVDCPAATHRIPRLGMHTEVDRPRSRPGLRRIFRPAASRYGHSSLHC